MKSTNTSTHSCGSRASARARTRIVALLSLGLMLFHCLGLTEAKVIVMQVQQEAEGKCKTKLLRRESRKEKAESLIEANGQMTDLKSESEHDDAEAYEQMREGVVDLELEQIENEHEDKGERYTHVHDGDGYDNDHDHDDDHEDGQAQPQLLQVELNQEGSVSESMSNSKSQYISSHQRLARRSRTSRRRSVGQRRRRRRRSSQNMPSVSPSAPPVSESTSQTQSGSNQQVTAGAYNTQLATLKNIDATDLNHRYNR